LIAVLFFFTFALAVFQLSLSTAKLTLPAEAQSSSTAFKLTLPAEAQSSFTAFKGQHVNHYITDAVDKLS
jgi:hypothetical protein